MVDEEPIAADTQALEHLVARLTNEVEGLRAALRYRGVIEQAKGVLMARTGADPDAAFRCLVARSQHANLKLTRVAAAVVAHALSHPPRVVERDPSTDELLAAARSTEARNHLTSAAVSSASDLHDLLHTLVRELGDLRVGSSVIAATEPDGALRLLAWEAMGSDEIAGWERIPPHVHVPLTEAAASGQPVFVSDRRTAVERFPTLGRLTLASEALAALPLHVDGRCIGALGFGWDDAYDFPDAATTRLVDAARRCATTVSRLLRDRQDELAALQVEPGYDAWFRAVLEGIPTPVVLLEPVLADGRKVVDLRMLHLNAAASGLAAAPRVGQSLLERWPKLATNGTLERLREVLSSGAPYRREHCELTGIDTPTLTLRQLNVMRIGSLLAATCLGPTSEDRQVRWTAPKKR